jgi:hypothetical protein
VPFTRIIPLRWILRAAAASTSLLAGGCNPFDPKPEAKVDPNLFPTEYKSQILRVLQTTLTDRSSFLGAGISPPVLKTFGTDSRYVVCVRIAGAAPAEKTAIFFGGQLNQFVDAKEGMCAGAAYEPFRELAPK